MSELAALIAALRRDLSSLALERMGRALAPFLSQRSRPQGSDRIEAFSPLDDAGAIRADEDFLLLASDGPWDAPDETEGRIVGRTSALSCATRLSAMGGTPEGLSVFMMCGDDIFSTEAMTGLLEVCRALAVPLLGARIEPEAIRTSLSTVMVGRARTLVPGGAAKPGDALLAAVDLRGKRTARTLFNWEPSLDRPPGALPRDLNLPVQIAENGWLRSGRSAAGIGVVGTAILLAEASRVGCRIDLDSIPRPKGIDLPAWLLARPEFAFVFSAHPRDAQAVIDTFQERFIACDRIGEVSIGRVVELRLGNDVRPLVDLRKQQFLRREHP